MCPRRSRMMSNGLDAESGPSRHVGSNSLVAEARDGRFLAGISPPATVGVDLSVEVPL